MFPSGVPGVLVVVPSGESRRLPDRTGAGELLEQQQLVGVAPREPIRRVAERHLKRALSGTVAQPLGAGRVTFAPENPSSQNTAHR
jgi:hypothetical protein